MKKIISFVLAVIVLISVNGCAIFNDYIDPIYTNEDADETEETSKNTDTSTGEDEGKLYHVEYLWRKLCFGMTYEEVCEAMGSAGQNAGVSLSGAIEYEWFGKDDMEENASIDDQKVIVSFMEIDNQLIVIRYQVWCNFNKVSKTYDNYDNDPEDFPEYENLSYVEKEARKFKIGLEQMEVIDLFGEPTRNVGSHYPSWVYDCGDEGVFTIAYDRSHACSYLALSPLGR